MSGILRTSSFVSRHSLVLAASSSGVIGKSEASISLHSLFYCDCMKLGLAA